MTTVFIITLKNINILLIILINEQSFKGLGLALYTVRSHHQCVSCVAAVGPSCCVQCWLGSSCFPSSLTCGRHHLPLAKSSCRRSAATTRPPSAPSCTPSWTSPGTSGCDMRIWWENEHGTRRHTVISSLLLFRLTQSFYPDGGV